MRLYMLVEVGAVCFVYFAGNFKGKVEGLSNIDCRCRTFVLANSPKKKEEASSFRLFDGKAVKIYAVVNRSHVIKLVPTVESPEGIADRHIGELFERSVDRKIVGFDWIVI